MIWPDTRHGGLGDRDFRHDQIIIERQDCRALQPIMGAKGKLMASEVSGQQSTIASSCTAAPATFS